MKISSSAFSQNGKIPRKYTADGENISPPLEWSGVPEGTGQLALILHDPDAPLLHGFTHWVLYGISSSSKGLSESMRPDVSIIEGKNSAGELGYMGPAPPKGDGPHHYFFWLYALDNKMPRLDPGMTSDQLIAAMEAHVLGPAFPKEQTRLVGTYERL
jgi:Raf kinase inhibitor-like YbhB/YbcL family protein